MKDFIKEKKSQLIIISFIKYKVYEFIIKRDLWKNLYVQLMIEVDKLLSISPLI